MKNATSKVSSNKTSKRSYALKELLEKQGINLIENREDSPYETANQNVNTRTIQFISNAPVLSKDPISNLS